MPETRAIFLDLDDTILDFGRAEASALRRTLIEEDIPAGDAVLARYHDINAAQWRLLESRREAGEHTIHGLPTMYRVLCESQP